jgi:hypothetical protein
MLRPSELGLYMYCVLGSNIGVASFVSLEAGGSVGEREKDGSTRESVCTKTQ